MKQFLLISILLWQAINSCLAQTQITRCASHVYNEQLRQQDPVFNQNLIEEETRLQSNEVAERSAAIITIPVVVHVLYNTTSQNISLTQIQSQIDQLNKDYGKKNADTSIVPQVYKNRIANVEIQFCLAATDPAGATTTGITRTQTTKTSFDLNTDEAKFTNLGGQNIWDRNKYLNLWVVPGIHQGSSTNILGYAQFPGGPASTDGVVIWYRAFGTMGTAAFPYDEGRTGTHEIAHWLNLLHIWGDDGGGCVQDDGVGDTPKQKDSNYGCPSFPQTSSAPGGSCYPDSSAMYMNFMDYSDDPCMVMFTNGQKARIRSAIDNMRAGLKTSTAGCQVTGITEKEDQLKISIVPNPGNGFFTLNSETYLEQATIEVHDLNGRKCYSSDASGYTFNMEVDLPAGLYYLTLFNKHGQNLAKSKLLITR